MRMAYNSDKGGSLSRVERSLVDFVCSALSPRSSAVINEQVASIAEIRRESLKGSEHIFLRLDKARRHRLLWQAGGSLEFCRVEGAASGSRFVCFCSVIDGRFASIHLSRSIRRHEVGAVSFDAIQVFHDPIDPIVITDCGDESASRAGWVHDHIPVGDPSLSAPCRLPSDHYYFRRVTARLPGDFIEFLRTTNGYENAVLTVPPVEKIHPVMIGDGFYFAVLHVHDGPTFLVKDGDETGVIYRVSNHDDDEVEPTDRSFQDVLNHSMRRDLRGDE